MEELNTRIIFVNIKDVNLQYETRINGNNIYAYINGKKSKAPIKYFAVKQQFFGIMENKKLYVINTTDTDFTPTIMRKFKFLDDAMLDVLNVAKTHTRKFTTESQKLKKAIISKFHKIDGFEYINVHINQHPIVDLTAAKHALHQLNQRLGSKKYTMTIDYIFAMKENTDVYSTSNEICTTIIMLGLYTNDGICVSSIEILPYLPRNELEINSGTKEEFRGKKMNTLLQTVLVLIATQIHPTIEYIISYGDDPILVHIMVNTLNAIPYDEEYGHKEVIPFEQMASFADIKKYMRTSEGIASRIFLTEENIHNAKNVFDNISGLF
jgi:hypothetical protein